MLMNIKNARETTLRAWTSDLGVGLWADMMTMMGRVTLANRHLLVTSVAPSRLG